jgi:hypothetical protein
MRWTKEQLEEYKARMEKVSTLDIDETPDVGRESKLQAKCIRYCKERGFPVFHDYSRKRNQPGWPDLFVFVDNHVTMVELKASTGTLRKEQRELRRVLGWLGHPVHVVRSYAGFVRVMLETTKESK